MYICICAASTERGCVLWRPRLVFLYTCMCGTWLIHLRGMAYSSVWHDSCFVECGEYRCQVLCACSCVRSDSIICVAWLSNMCDSIYSCVCHNSYGVLGAVKPEAISPVHAHVCNVAHSFVWHDSFIGVICLIRMCHMTHSYVSHNSFICVT